VTIRAKIRSFGDEKRTEEPSNAVSISDRPEFVLWVFVSIDNAVSHCPISTGEWYGFAVDATQSSSSFIIRWSLKATEAISETETQITGKGRVFPLSTWVLLGTLTGTKGQDHYALAAEHRYSDNSVFLYNGTFSISKLIIIAEWSSKDSSAKGTLFLKQTPTPHLMTYRWPFEEKLTSKQLWSFARNAVLYDVRRRQFNTEFVYKRIKAIVRWFKLSLSEDLTEEELREVAELSKLFLADEGNCMNHLVRWYGE
jgi:hypothetical protein